MTVGELRQLSNKKAGLQKVDVAKETYKFDELEVESGAGGIDEEQQQLTAQ